MQIIIKIKKEANNIFVELKKYVMPTNTHGCHKTRCHSRVGGNSVLQNFLKDFFKACFILLYAEFLLLRA
ncbi:hypothetical protein MCI_01015 [Rickettsia montanensis str. OSU 85-930]|uniref:Uncharacterized protein n=1 Tax=Rickettsia montanensis (strain OSU 85-930) TaxID=1105114 RepID=H8KAU5_RICMS|nr:hypothetical protein MCI_01015 [Rickettsia montanensis str. OSU 85-930]